MASEIERLPCFHHVIQYWAEHRPDTAAFNFLADGEEVSDSLSFSELDKRARQVAIFLQQKELHKQPVLLQFRPGIDFIVAFFGCLYAGAIAVSAYPPGNNRSKTDRLEKLIASCQASIILTNLETSSDVIRESGDIGLSLLYLDDTVSLDPAAWTSPELNEQDIAFLQYSSGSTGDPKGVVITHQNLMSNQKAIKKGMGNGDHTVFASWLPLFHDMGLVGNVMQPIYLGVTCWLMPPMAFLQKPIRWLRLISNAGVTCTGGPNFSYELCVSRVSEEDRTSLDLSKWEVAYNGAEPIRSDTIQRFQDTYKPHGLKKQAIFLCYGLAEATLFVTGSGAARGAERLEVCSKKLSEGIADTDTDHPVLSLVSSGQLWDGVDLAIVEPNSHQRRAENQVGEIWLKGDSVSRGYWNAPEHNQNLLSQITNEGNQVWLRTGDLGFIRNGQLFVTGRLKEVLIIRGRNHYPQDIEHTVQQAYPGLTVGNGAAFLADDELVVVQELQRTAIRRFDHHAALEAVRQAVSEKHGLMLAHFVALKPGGVLKTSSGKLRRRHMSELWQSGCLVSIGQERSVSENKLDKPTSELGRVLVSKGIKALPHQTLSSLGIDSLLRLELHALIQDQLKIDIPLEWFLDELTISQIELNLEQLPARTMEVDAVSYQKSTALTPWQQAIWLHQQRFPESSCFNLATELQLDHPMEARAVKRLLQNIAELHPQLSAVLRGNEWVADTRIDITELPIDNWSDSRRISWLTEFRTIPFNLNNQAPWRCALLCEDGRCTRIAISVHHIALDATAAQTLIRDLSSSLLGKEVKSNSVTLPEMLGALSQVANVEAKVQPKLIEALLDAPEHIDFNLPKPGIPEKIASVRYRLSHGMSTALYHFVSETGTTMHSLTSAAFAGLLARYSEGNVISLGIPTSIRRHDQHHWVNNAVNVVPMPVSIDDSVSLRALVCQTVEQTKLVLQNRNIPYVTFLDKVRQIQPGRNQLYHALFSCQPEGQLPPADIPMVASQSTFSLMVFPSPDEVVFDLEFDPVLIAHRDARRMLDHLVNLLIAGIQNPDRPLRQINFLSNDEMAELGLLFRQPQNETVPFEDVITRFQRQTDHSPEAIAVEDADGQCTYLELYNLVSSYVRALRKQSIDNGDRVAIALPRDRHLPAAILAVHAIGAIYVPLDFEYPQDRLSLITEDSECRLVITHRPNQFPHLNCLEPVQAQSHIVQRLTPVSAEAIAYVLYTSGSTGKPKGVQVTHANISALLSWAESQFTERERHRVLASTSICFDLSVFELFVPLCLGTTCVMVDAILDLLSSPVDVSLVNTVPSAVEVLLAHDAFPKTAQAALIAGEPFHQSLVERLLDTVRLPRLFDLYGPTEDTVYSTCGERRIGDIATIGKILPCTRGYILDRHQQPVADGVAGELWLSGDKVSAGYLNRPSLNQAAFQVPAVLEHLEDKAYRTGDRVRRLQDGRLLYLGRLDHQVKLRGYRIELSEVERQIMSCPGVEKAVVKVVPNSQGNDVLAAWYATDERSPDSQVLRKALASKVPEWMIPGIWSPCEAFPQTPNGKIDRAALQLPAMEETVSGTQLREDEKQLADIWASVLGNPPQDRDSHFINLGGNSLLALQLREKLNQHFGADIPLTLLLTHRVLGEQADALIEYLDKQPLQEELEEISI
ncbi:hypothetical protein BTA51_26090 [Hahella sp. CCB-MM4]|uniref:non-ribosomal peptide synthetase n=1 Tax=Hahella sp. (strain CCB-MM4) TaxID=1926491 RepID=UPI000B9A90BD|nr:non-ribosomal peptide synthetase [Hahella sp. CCB-MM4]OZG70442.1 hypothetical protein BTA51_26090 [Hahella sp. CCB-MM4]